VVEPASELPDEFSYKPASALAGVESIAGSLTNVPCITCFSSQFQAAVSSKIASLLTNTLPFTGLYSL